MYQKRRKTSIGCCFFQSLVFVSLAIALFILVNNYLTKQNQVLSPLADDYVPSVSLIEFITHDKDPDVLQKLVKEKIGSSWRNYSILVRSYNSKFVFGINESVMFTAASVNKVPILAALYSEVQKGNVSLSKVITLQDSDIQDYGTGSIRYDPPGSTYSIKTLARLMMQQSDNTAAYILANYVLSFETIQHYVNDWGMTQTDMVNNQTSNSDMAVLFEKIYHKKLVNSALSDELLALLKDSDFEDRIPAELPTDVVVYHKIGTGVGGVHDVGVVVHDNMKYYIGIFTSDIVDEEQAAKLLGDVSKIVYEFLK